MTFAIASQANTHAMETGAPLAVLAYPLPPARYYGSRAPPRPPAGKYAMFGSVYSVDDEAVSLSGAGRPTLYSSNESPCDALRKLNRRLLALFTGLLRSLTDVDSADTDRIVTAIEHVFVNMQHIINLLRPAQARAGVVSLLNVQARDRSAAAQELNAAAGNARARAREALATLATGPGISAGLAAARSQALSGVPALNVALAQSAGLANMQPSSTLTPLASPGTAAMRELEDLL